MTLELPRCQVIPLPEHQTAFLIDGRERTRWHFGPQYPRPFFYPFHGPSGQTLTRMGHPGAANHDHHRSIWFAHEKLLGINFWSDQSQARIVQSQWLAYEDADDECRMAVQLRWYDGHDPAELITQELIAAVRSPNSQVNSGETLLEIQTRFLPRAETIEFQKTNFGFFAVRVAKNISAYFGGGQLTNSEGQVGEPDIFGKSAKWMDYSGPVPQADAGSEGITYFDHPSNPGQPTSWHVREDGWMGAAPCLHGPLETTKDKPITLRYLLHAHAGKIDVEQANALHQQFADLPALNLVKSTQKHMTWEIQRRV